MRPFKDPAAAELQISATLTRADRARATDP